MFRSGACRRPVALCAALLWLVTVLSLSTTLPREIRAQGVPILTVSDVSRAETNAGTTTFTFAVTLTAPAGPGGVTFDIATADGTAQDDNPAIEDNDYVAQSLTGQSIPMGSTGPYNFSVTVNGGITPESDETFFVNVTNVTGANVADGQGQGTIVNDDLSLIHDVQGNGAATPIPGATVSVEGVVTGNFQGVTKLQGFFLQEETLDEDADPATSEGIFIFCDTCPTAVAEGQRVTVTGTVSEFNNRTQIAATTPGSVVVNNAGNNLGDVTPASIDLPVVGAVNDFYESRESMKVTFVDPLTVADTDDLDLFGQLTLFQGGRPTAFTEGNAPSVAGNAAQADNLARRRVILDDDNDTQASHLATSTPSGPANGSQSVYHPRANGGFSVGTQGFDFVRSGDLVAGLTGILDWDSPGAGSPSWRVRPTAANPAVFTVANPRPATPPAVGGSIRVASIPLGNYFTTIDTTSSTTTGSCSPSGGAECIGADSDAELNRQRERASIVVCAINGDVLGLTGLENTASSGAITDLLGAINARCGGAHPYAFVNTGGALGADVTRVQLIYRTGAMSPVGSSLVDLDPIHVRPPTAQTFDVVDGSNAAFGQRFTVIVTDFKGRDCTGASGGDADAGDGQDCFNATRTQEASRLVMWIAGTVLPAAGDPDVLLLGDFNAFAREDPITTLTAGGYVDLPTSLQGGSAYTNVIAGQIGQLNRALASASFATQVTGVDEWHINADESDLFDYNDETRDTGEAQTEEKPDGSALVPPRVVFQPASPYRAANADPVLVGLFPSTDLSITKTDGVTSATPGGTVTYTIVATNSGPNPVTGATVTDTFPASLTVSWTCVGDGGGTCTAGPVNGNINDTVNLPVGGSVTYTATATVSASATGTIANTARVTVPGGIIDPNPGNDFSTDTDTLPTPQADLGITKTDGVTSVTPGGSVTYTIIATNAGPTPVIGATVTDTFPASLTVSWTCVGTGGATCTAGPVNGNINDTVNLPVGGSVTYTATAAISSAAIGTLSNTASVAVPAGINDSNPGNDSDTDTDIVTVTDVNDPPVNTVPGAQSTPGNSPLTISAANRNAISVADADAGGADVQTVLTVPAGQGTLMPGAAGTVPPLTTVSGSGTNSLTLVGSLAEINAALNGLTYTPPNGFTGTTVLTVTTNDLGNMPAPAQQDQDTVQIAVGVLPAVSVNDPAAVVEGDTGGTNSITFTVTLSAPSTLSVQVPFSTANGTTTPATGGPTCTAAVDFLTTNGTLTFAPTETSKTIVVSVCGDASLEGHETLLVNLGQPTNAVPGDSQGVGTITDDDQAGAITFSAASSSVPENAGSATIIVQRSGAGPAATGSSTSPPAGPPAGTGVPSGSVVPGGSVRPNPPASPPASAGGTVAPSALAPVTVTYATADVTATAGLDYVATAGTLTFGVNETTKTIVVPILNDSLQEGPEQFTIVLSGPTGGASLGQAVITVTIIDTTHGAPTPPGDDSADDEREERERETEEERRQRARTNQGNKDDDSVEGDVIETRCDQFWPSVMIANRDGAVEVKLVKEAQAACSSISVGDYLEADGEKQHEGLFHADSVEIKRRR